MVSLNLVMISFGLQISSHRCHSSGRALYFVLNHELCKRSVMPSVLWELNSVSSTLERAKNLCFSSYFHLQSQKNDSPPFVVTHKFIFYRKIADSGEYNILLQLPTFLTTKTCGLCCHGTHALMTSFTIVRA